MNWTAQSVDQNRTSLRYYRNTTLSLPLDASWFSFVSEGPLAHGTFEVSPTAPRGSTEAVVDIDVSYNQVNAMNGLTTCLTRSGAEWGLGIFVRQLLPFSASVVSRRLPGIAYPRDTPSEIPKLA